MTISKFELYKDPHGGFRWKLKSTEGRTIAVSAEAYNTMADLLQNIATVKRQAGVSDIDDQTAVGRNGIAAAGKMAEPRVEGRHFRP